MNNLIIPPYFGSIKAGVIMCAPFNSNLTTVCNVEQTVLQMKKQDGAIKYKDGEAWKYLHSSWFLNITNCFFMLTDDLCFDTTLWFFLFYIFIIELFYKRKKIFLLFV